MGFSLLRFEAFRCFDFLCFIKRLLSIVLLWHWVFYALTRTQKTNSGDSQQNSNINNKTTGNVSLAT